MKNIKSILLHGVVVLSLFYITSCDDKDEPLKGMTYEQMIGTWYLIDRGPNLDSTITACEKREYLVFRADSTAMRHQDCLPKADFEGAWSVQGDVCKVWMDILFQGVQVSTAEESIDFFLVDENTIKVEKQYPLFMAWGLYQKTEE